MQKAYSSDLTDAQWEVIKPVFADQRQYEKHSPRQIMNALFYLLKSGCQWRMLPNDFAPWKTVYDHFQKWIESGRAPERLCTRLRRAVRLMAGRHPSPSAAVIDAQSVPTARQGGPKRGPKRGYDGGKNVKGRKRHVVVDTMGLVLAVVVGSANESEGQKAPHVFQRLLGKVPRLEVVFADKGYEGTPGGLIERCFGWLIEVVRREKEDSPSGFEPIPKRWVVERTFGWFASWRRLSRDYEYHPETSEAMIQIGMSRLMISRLT